MAKWKCPFPVLFLSVVTCDLVLWWWMRWWMNTWSCQLFTERVIGQSWRHVYTWRHQHMILFHQLAWNEQWGWSGAQWVTRTQISSNKPPGADETMFFCIKLALMLMNYCFLLSACDQSCVSIISLMWINRGDWNESCRHCAVRTWLILI